MDDLDKAIELLKDEVAYRETASPGSYDDVITRAMKTLCEFARFAEEVLPPETVASFKSGTPQVKTAKRKAELVSFVPLKPTMGDGPLQFARHQNTNRLTEGIPPGATITHAGSVTALDDTMQRHIDQFLPDKVVPLFKRDTGKHEVYDQFVSSVEIYSNGMMNIILQYFGYPAPTHFIRVR